VNGHGSALREQDSSGNLLSKLPDVLTTLLAAWRKKSRGDEAGEGAEESHASSHQRRGDDSSFDGDRKAIPVAAGGHGREGPLDGVLCARDVCVIALLELENRDARKGVNAG
jgi:hypothetical protein